MQRRIGVGFVAAALLCAPTVAIAGPHDEAIVEIVDAAVADWSVFLSCSVLVARKHELLREWWDEEREDFEDVLAEADVTPEFASDIMARLTPERLMALTEGDVPTLMEFCRQTDWEREIDRFNFVRPATELGRLL